MTEREVFESLLAKDEDALTTRLVFADWLDEHGEHEEAERHRKWPEAKEWLLKFCADNNPPADEEPEEWIMDYKTLLDLGADSLQAGTEYNGEKWFGFSTGNNMGMQDALYSNVSKFWEVISILSGIPLPPDIEKSSGFSCAC